MTNSTAPATAARRFAEALRYYTNGKEADRRWRAGVGADEDGRYRVEGRFAHEWFSLARSAASLAGQTLDDVRAAYAA